MRGLQSFRNDPRSVFPVLWAVFFFQGMTLGAWLPALTNIFGAHGWQEWVPLAFMIPPVCAIIGPLWVGALADHSVPADVVFRWTSLLGAVTLVAAFGVMDAGWHPMWFMSLLGVNALVGRPTWALLSTVSLNNLKHPERQFSLVRVGGTIGWIAGGVMTSYLLHADSSPVAGYAAGLVGLIAVALSFALPHTPPLGKATGWKSRLGIDAFGLLKERDHLVFFVVTALFSVPISAFYMYGPEFLMVLGDPRPTGTMTIGQVLEIASMLVLGGLLARHSVKAVLLWALGLSVVRFAMSAQAGVSGEIAWHVGGLALHGVCFAFYFVTAQIFLDRRVAPGLKAQAQGLLTVVGGGLGPLAGSWFCGWLRLRVVTADGQGWTEFWGILAAMIAVCFVVFATCYRGLGKPSRSVS